MYFNIVLEPDVVTVGLPVVVPEYLAVGIESITTNALEGMKVVEIIERIYKSV